jgi:methyl-accepting chemotaxis protein
MLTEIGRVDDAVRTIAAAAQEQAASSLEISDLAAAASRDMGDVAREIAKIADSAEETDNAMRKVSAEAGDLAALSANLEEVIADFRIA